MASGEGRPRGAELMETSQGDLVPGPELWQENAGLPWLVGPNALLSPAMYWAEEEGAQLQRETKAFLTEKDASRMGVSSLGWRGPGASEQPVRHKMQTPLPQAHPQPFTPSRLDQTLPLTLSNPAGPSLPFGVRTNNLGRKWWRLPL